MNTQQDPLPNPVHSERLTKRAFHAAKWNYVGVIVRTVSSFAVGLVLARLLGPKPFGQIAIALIISTLGRLIANFGFSAVLVQRKELSKADIEFAFTLNFLMSCVITVVVFAAAGPLAALFRQPEVVPIVRAVSFTFVLEAFGVTSMGLLKRELAYKRIQTSFVTSYLVGYMVLGIPLAYMGFGVWSLVVAQLSQVLIYSAMLYGITRHSIRPRFTTDQRQILHLGIKITSTNILNWGITNLDNAVVGRYFGAIALGLYSRAFQLAWMPTDSVVSTIQQVLFSAGSRVQDRLESLQKAYLSSITIIGLTIGPVFFTVALVSHTVIVGLLGPRWVDAAPLLEPLSIAMLFQAQLAVAGPMIWATGKVEKELWVEAATLVITLFVLAVATHFTVVALSWAMLCVYMARWLMLTQSLIGLLKLSWERVISALKGGLLVSAVTAFVTYGVDHALSFISRTPVRLAVDIVAAAVILLAMLSLLRTHVVSTELRPQATIVLKKIREKLGLRPAIS